METLAGMGDPRNATLEVPIHSAAEGKLDSFFSKVKSKFYNMPDALREIANARNFKLNETQAAIRSSRKLQKIINKAVDSGASIEDIRMLFGTTSPSVTNADRQQVRDEVAKKEQELIDDGVTGKTLAEQLDEFERAKFAAIANNYKTEFVKAKEAARARLLDGGYTELVTEVGVIRNKIDEKQAELKMDLDASGEVYLTRAYRFFTTEGWAQMALNGGKHIVNGVEVDFDLLRAQAANLYEEESRRYFEKRGKDYSEEDVVTRTKGMLDNYLSSLNAITDQKLTIGSGTASQIRQDLNRLKPKADIDGAMRTLLGEHTDPLYNAMNTLQNVSLMAANRKFQTDFAQMAISLGLASKTRRGPKFQKWKGDSAMDKEAYGPLAGLYVDVGVAAALEEVFGGSPDTPQTTIAKAMETVTRTTARLSGLSVLAKTRYGFGYWPRNSVGGLLMSTAQGIIPAGKAFQSFQFARQAAFGKLTGKEQRDEIEKLIRLGVANDRGQSRIVQDMMRGTAAGSETELAEIMADLHEAQESGNGEEVKKRLVSKFGFLKSTYKGVKGVNNWLSSLDAAIENMYRINAYYYEKAVMDKHYANPDGTSKRSEEFKENEAAKKVQITFPGSSNTVDIAKQFQRSPLALAVVPFISWKSEVFRTMVQTVPLAMREIKEGGAMGVRGVRRLVGFAGTLAFAPAVVGTLASLIFRALSDREEEDRELTPMEKWALRQSLPNWQQGHSLYAHKLKDGSIRYLDMTYILPHTAMTDVFDIIADGARTGKGVDGSRLAQYVASEWFGEQIAFGAVTKLKSNMDDFKQPIWLESDPSHVQLGKQLSYLASQAFKPSAAAKLQQFTRSGEQRRGDLIAGEIIGVRPKFDKMDVLNLRAMQRMKRELDSVVREGGKAATSRYLSEEDFFDVLDKRQSGVDANRQKLHDYMHTMMSLGVSLGELMDAGDQAGYSDRSLELAYAGLSEVWTGPTNPSYLQKMSNNMLRGEEQDPLERIEMGAKWQSNHAAYHELKKLNP